jgi:hypothetical protein
VDDLQVVAGGERLRHVVQQRPYLRLVPCAIQGHAQVIAVQVLLGPADSGGRIADLDRVGQDLHHALRVDGREQFDLAVRPLQCDIAVRVLREQHDLRDGRRPA